MRTEKVAVPVPVRCVEPDATPKSRFVANGSVDQDAAAAALELREWRAFGKEVVKQCGVNQ